MTKKSSDSSSNIRRLTREEIQSYRQFIEVLARDNVNQRIPNGHPVHASVLVEAMFEKAEREMRIFTGSLAAETYDEPLLVDAACRFLTKPRSRLRILLQQPMQKTDVLSRKMVSEILAMRARRVGTFDVRVADPAYAHDDHYAVMDDGGFRFEVDHTETTAVANFNEPSVARELASGFDVAFGLGVPVDIF